MSFQGGGRLESKVVDSFRYEVVHSPVPRLMQSRQAANLSLSAIEFVAPTGC